MVFIYGVYILLVMCCDRMLNHTMSYSMSWHYGTVGEVEDGDNDYFLFPLHIETKEKKIHDTISKGGAKACSQCSLEYTIFGLSVLFLHATHILSMSLPSFRYSTSVRNSSVHGAC